MNGNNKQNTEVVARFTIGQVYMSFSDFIQWLLDNMEDPVMVSDTEVCGNVYGHYICVDPEHRVIIIPIVPDNSCIPYQIEIYEIEVI